MKNLPLGLQGFRKIIEGNYVYVDKTRFVYEILNDVSYYFLSRPRRFGKSLFLDTIAEAFSGDKELFKGLYIYDTDYAFEKHPVIRIDMSNIANDSPKKLESALIETLKKRIIEEELNIDSKLLSSMFKFLIEALHKKYDKRVVVLIDEFDKPMLDHLHNKELSEANRDIVKGFYVILKSMDPHLRLIFVTGVTKFTKTTIFSGFNNLFDITMMEDYADICGIKVEELDKYFGEHIDNLASKKGFGNSKDLHKKILEWYDGYSWDAVSRLINPFSLLSFFKRKRFFTFWYSSGTPTFLIKLIKEKPPVFLALEDLEMSELSLDLVDNREISIAPLLFQSGYLTVDEVMYDPPPAFYRLRMPNFEVREAFNLQVISEFTENDHDITETAYRHIRKSLESGNLQAMLDILKSLFASIPYQLHVSSEAYYHSIFYAVMTVLGFDIDAEVSVSGGRIDATLDLDDRVYVMEFKYVSCPPDTSPESKRNLFDKALEDGVKQIDGKGYAKKYEGGGIAITRAVFAFIGRDEIEMHTW